MYFVWTKNSYTCTKNSEFARNDIIFLNEKNIYTCPKTTNFFQSKIVLYYSRKTDSSCRALHLRYVLNTALLFFVLAKLNRIVHKLIRLIVILEFSYKILYWFNLFLDKLRQVALDRSEQLLPETWPHQVTARPTTFTQIF